MLTKTFSFSVAVVLLCIVSLGPPASGQCQSPTGDCSTMPITNLPSAIWPPRGTWQRVRVDGNYQPCPYGHYRMVVNRVYDGPNRDQQVSFSCQFTNPSATSALIIDPIPTGDGLSHLREFRINEMNCPNIPAGYYRIRDADPSILYIRDAAPATTGWYYMPVRGYRTKVLVQFGNPPQTKHISLDNYDILRSRNLSDWTFHFSAFASVPGTLLNEDRPETPEDETDFATRINCRDYSHLGSQQLYIDPRLPQVVQLTMNAREKPCLDGPPGQSCSPTTGERVNDCDNVPGRTVEGGPQEKVVTLMLATMPLANFLAGNGYFASTLASDPLLNEPKRFTYAVGGNELYRPDGGYQVLHPIPSSPNYCRSANQCCGEDYSTPPSGGGDCRELRQYHDERWYFAVPPNPASPGDQHPNWNGIGIGATVISGDAYTFFDDLCSGCDANNPEAWLLYKWVGKFTSTYRWNGGHIAAYPLTTLNLLATDTQPNDLIPVAYRYTTQLDQQVEFPTPAGGGGSASDCRAVRARMLHDAFPGSPERFPLPAQDGQVQRMYNGLVGRVGNTSGVGYQSLYDGEAGWCPCPIASATVCAGACCMGTACTQTTPSGCDSPGVYKGNGTACSPNPCLSTGACCSGGTNCAVLTAQACGQIVGAVYRGNGTNCSASLCMMPPPVDCESRDDCEFGAGGGAEGAGAFNHHGKTYQYYTRNGFSSPAYGVFYRMFDRSDARFRDFKNCRLPIWGTSLPVDPPERVMLWTNPVDRTTPWARAFGHGEVFLGPAPDPRGPGVCGGPTDAERPRRPYVLFHSKVDNALFRYTSFKELNFGTDGTIIPIINEPSQAFSRTDPLVFLVPWDGPACWGQLGDLNGDGCKTTGDLYGFLDEFFGSFLRADLNGSGIVDVGDLFIFLDDWYRACWPLPQEVCTTPPLP